jgi:hypothetical protein
VTKPKTAAEVMALPVLREYEEIDCPHCHHKIMRRLPSKLHLSPVAGDDVLFVTAPDGNWQPICTEDGWFRKRFP